MNVKRIENRIAVECQHCLGTTECQHAVHFDNGADVSHGTVEHWLMCQKCGEGYHATEKRDFDSPPFDAPLHHPSSVVCNGRGFIIT